MLPHYIFSTLSLKPQPCNFGEVQKQALLFWGHLSRPGDVSRPVPGVWFTSAWLRFQFESELKDGSQTVAICPVFIAVNHAGWLVGCTCHGSLLQQLCVDFGRKGVRDPLPLNSFTQSYIINCILQRHAQLHLKNALAG